MGRISSAVALVLFVTLLSSCGSDKSESPEPEGASVTAPGGNAARTGVLPGPAIDGAPELRWKVHVPGEGLSPLGGLAALDGTVYVGGLGGHLVALDAESGEERWQATVEPWWTSLAVAEGLVYVTGGEYLYALDAEKGEEGWRFQMTATAGPSPVVADGAVFVGSEDGHIYAVDALNGKELWRSQVSEEYPGSAAVVDGVVYADGRTDTWALDAATGRERWSFRKGYPSWPSSLSVSEGAVFLGDNDRIYSIDAATGEELWHMRANDAWALPAVAQGLVYLQDYGTGTSFYRFRAFDVRIGDVRWSLDTTSDDPGQPVVVGDVLYLGGDALYALDAKTGEEIWHFDIETEDKYDGSILPTVMDGIIYAAVCLDLAYEVGCEEGNSYVYAIGGTGEPPEGEARLSPRTPDPTATWPIPPTPVHRNSGATPPVLIDSPGTWTLRDLGYADVWLDEDSGIVVELERPPSSRRLADPILYALPPGASQGAELLYTLHFHFEVIFRDEIDAEDRGHQELRVTVNANLGTNVSTDFDTARQGDSLVVDCEYDCPTTQRREGDEIIVHAEMWYSNGIPVRGILPGVNQLWVGIPADDLPPRFEAVHVFDDTYIEVAAVSPQ